MKYLKLAAYLTFCVSVLTSNRSLAQKKCDNTAMATLGLLYVTGAFDTDNDRTFFPTNNYGVSQLLLEKLEIPYSDMQAGDYSIRETGETKTLFYHSEDGEIRPYEIIVVKERYYLLAPTIKSDLCDYKANTVLFIPEKDYLKHVETVFSFSLRKDLSNKLDQELGVKIDPKQFNRFCEMLAYLKR